MDGATTAALALEDCQERLLVTGADAAALECKDLFSGETPLITQIQLGERENALRVLQAGADANAATAGTPLLPSCARAPDLLCVRAGVRACLLAHLRDDPRAPGTPGSLSERSGGRAARPTTGGARRARRGLRQGNTE